MIDVKQFHEQDVQRKNNEAFKRVKKGSRVVLHTYFVIKTRHI